MRPFAKQVEIEIGQDGREPIGVLDLDLLFAIACTQAVAARAVRQAALEQASVMNALQIAFVPPVVDHSHSLRVRKEDAHDRDVAREMRAEIAEGVGMATLDNRIGFGCKRAHSAGRSARERMRQVPASGTRSQLGRCASSYSIS